MISFSKIKQRKMKMESSTTSVYRPNINNITSPITLNIMETFLNSINNSEDINYFGTKIFDIYESFVHDNSNHPNYVEKITDMIEENVIPRYNDLQSLKTYINTSDTLKVFGESVDDFIYCDRILKNDKTINKRFDMKSFIKSNSNMDLDEMVRSLCEFIDTYDISTEAKYNIALENITFMLLSKDKTLDESVIQNHITDYFLMRESVMTDTYIRKLQKVAINSPLVNESTLNTYLFSKGHVYGDRIQSVLEYDLSTLTSERKVSEQIYTWLDEMCIDTPERNKRIMDNIIALPLAVNVSESFINGTLINYMNIHENSLFNQDIIKESLNQYKNGLNGIDFLNEKKNDINPMKLYFISELKGLKKLNPRIPNNYLTKNGYEDGKTARVCFSTDIGKCLTALSMNCAGRKYYVYSPAYQYNVKTPTIKQVPDVKITDEKWITETVDLVCIGKIECTKDKGTDGMPYKYGSNTAELYEWDWKWLEKYNVVNESKNDKGKEVPKICPKCGGDIGLFFKGEPVYLCKNCNKYFGTAPFPSNTNESVNSNIQIFNSPEELSKWMKSNIRYKDFSRLMSPQEVYDKKCGSCHDQVMFELYQLRKMNKSPKALFIIEYNNENTGRDNVTHSLVYYTDRNNIYWFENAWGGQEGIHKFTNIKELKDKIKELHSKKAFGNVNNYPELEITSFGVHKPGETLRQLVDKCVNEEYEIKNNSFNLLEAKLEKTDLNKAFDQFKAEQRKDSKAFQKVLNALYAKTPNEIINEFPHVLGLVRVAFVFAPIAIPIVGPVLTLVNACVDKILSYHINVKQSEKLFKYLRDEKTKVEEKLDDIDDEEKKKKAESYIKELEDSMKTVKKYASEELPKEIEDSDGNDDDFDDISFDDFDFDMELESYQITETTKEIPSVFTESAYENDDISLLADISLYEQSLEHILNNRVRINSMILRNIDTISENLRYFAPIIANCPTVIDYRVFSEAVKDYMYDPTSMDSVNVNGVLNKALENKFMSDTFKNTIIESECINTLDQIVTEGFNLNNVKLAFQALKKKMKDLNTKQKSICQTLDATGHQLISSIEKAVREDRREAVIKGSIIPSFSKCIKLGIALGGITAVNPVAGLITAVGYFGASSMLTQREKQLVYDEIATELQVVEKQLQIAENDGDMNQYRFLLNYQKKLARERQRIRYGLKVNGRRIPDARGPKRD